MVPLDLPEPIASNLPMGVTLCKGALLSLIAGKYKSTELQPFVRSIFQYAAAGAVSKIIFFAPPTAAAAYSGLGTGKAILQDISFVFPLVGVVVTMSLDFLWALSSSLESDTLFKRDVSESDFVIRWYKLQIPICVGLAAIRHLPAALLPASNELCFQTAINVTLIGSFGFVWACLMKVHGKSDSEKFKKAYKAAFIVNLLCTGLVAQNVFMVTRLMVRRTA